MDAIDSDTLVELLQSSDPRAVQAYMREHKRLQIVDWREYASQVAADAANVINDPEFQPIDTGDQLILQFKGEDYEVNLRGDRDDVKRTVLGLRNSLSRKYLLRIDDMSLESDTYWLYWMTYRDDRSLKKRNRELYESRFIDPFSLDVMS